MNKVMYRCLVWVLGVVCASGIGAQTVEIEPIGQRAIVLFDLQARTKVTVGERTMYLGPLQLVYWAGARGSPLMGLPPGWCILYRGQVLPSVIRSTSDANVALHDSCVGRQEYRFLANQWDGKFNNPYEETIKNPFETGGRSLRWVLVDAIEGEDFELKDGVQFLKGNMNNSFIQISGQGVLINEYSLNGFSSVLGRNRAMIIYDSNGRSVGPLGAGLWTQYDGVDIRPASLAYQVRPRGPGAKSRIPESDTLDASVRFHYSTEGVLERVTVLALPGSAGESAAKTWRLVRGADGLLAGLETEEGAERYRFTYDERSRLVDTINQAGKINSFVYWGEGHTLAVWIDESGCFTQMGRLRGNGEASYRTLEQKNCSKTLVNQKEYRLNDRGRVDAVITLTDSGREVKQ